MELIWLFLFIVTMAAFIFWSWASDLIDRNKRLERDNKNLTDELERWRALKVELDNQEKDIDWKKRAFNQLLSERSRNFPLVGEVWAELIDKIDSFHEKLLREKSRPAPKAADMVKAIKGEKRDLARELTMWKYKAQNYESIYPWLAEELAQDIEDDAQADIYFSVYSQEEREDPVTNYISPDDYRKLTVSARNQLALDRYWQRGRKTNWMIGKMYERYVGYLYEKNGWKVTYFGIHKRFEDLGRDLIATKGNEIHVIQCKNWSKFKTIYENHIFQLFGTAYSMRRDYPGKIVTPVFYTSTKLSEVANEFAKLLHIEVHEEEKFKMYPAIKCNVSSNGEKIYHLPFDQKYDDTIVTQKTGEFYAQTVLEAEAAGFRRAFRWRGVKSK